MPLWGNSTANENKPRWLSDADKENVYATKNGWVYRYPDGHEEVLIYIRDLETKLAGPNVTEVRFTANTYTRAANGTVLVAFNEKVTVTGTPTLNVVGGTTNATATYVSGTGTNQLKFNFTTPSVNQALTIPAQTIVVGTSNNITDAANTSVNAVATFGAGVLRPAPRNSNNNSIIIL